ncbi:hypothetical protein KI387_008290, partial [Taxus chinensis]
MGRGKPEEPKSNQITPRVTDRKGTRKPISGGSEDSVPRSTGTSGIKRRGGRKRAGRPADQPDHDT